MAALDLEVFPFMLDVMDLGRIGIDAALPILEHRPVFPTGFPQLVADLKVLISDFVALVVLGQPWLPKITRPALQI